MSPIELLVQKIFENIESGVLPAWMGQISADVYLLIFMVLAAVLLLGLVILPLSGFSTYVERRVAGRMQARIGCDRVGPEGVLQFMADGLKLVTKEDSIPEGADRFLFRLAPYLVVMGAFMSFVTIPFGKVFVVADLNIGLVFLLAVSSLVVVGILLAGWSSNNKWSLLGAMRSASQIVSYEIPLALALLVPVLLVGSLSLQDLNLAQAGGARNWIVFAAFPAPLIAMVVYFIAALAEVNRTPFDLPEAESELVSGFATEYSGMRWGLFFVGEYANMILVSAITVTAFLGGWQPSKVNIFFSSGALFFAFLFLFKTLTYAKTLLKELLSGKNIFVLISKVRAAKVPRGGFWFLAIISVLGGALLHLIADFWLVAFGIFLAKVYFFVLVMVWLRWTLPRIRVDQLMSLCWKKLVPIAFFCVFWTAVAILVSGGA